MKGTGGVGGLLNRLVDNNNSQRDQSDTIGPDEINGFSEVQYHGLINHGSTCYLNSVLQVLFMTKEFREAVNRFVEENPDTEFIDRHLKDLFDDLLRQTTSADGIIQALGINMSERQDAAEYLERILRLTSLRSAKIFHGQMAHRTTCSECKTESDIDGPFWHLPLELLDSSSGNYSVEDGIKMFFRASELGGENQMYCNTCYDKVNATSKYVIKHHPDVLILLLKRFDFNHQQMSFIKVSCSVDIPSTLKLQKTQTYELYAVVSHFGDLRSGHYITFIKSQDDGGRWYCFDDTKVSLLEWNPFPDNMNRTSSDEAYLLFYRRKEEAATGTEEEPMEVCMYEDQSAAGQTQKGDDARNVRRTRFLNQDTNFNKSLKSADGEMSAACSKHSKLNNALKRIKTRGKKQVDKRQKNETESPDSKVQRRHSEGGSNVLPNINYKEQSGGEGVLINADVEKERINSNVKEKRKERSESDGADSQEVSSAACEVRGRTQSDQRLRRNSSRKKKREKEVNRTDESQDADQRKLDDQYEHRRKYKKESHPDEGPLDQEKHISGSHKTQRNASKRPNKKQKTGGGESQRRSGSDTTERLRENQRAEEEETELENYQSKRVKIENERNINMGSDPTPGTKSSLPTCSGPDESFLSKQQKHKTEKDDLVKKKTDQSDGHGLKTYFNVELESDKGKNKQKKKSHKKIRGFLCLGQESD